MFYGHVDAVELLIVLLLDCIIVYDVWISVVVGLYGILLYGVWRCRLKSEGLTGVMFGLWCIVALTCVVGVGRCIDGLLLSLIHI